MTENISSRIGPIGDDPVQMASTATKLKTFTIAKGTKAQITQAYSDGLIGATDFAIATDEDLLDNKADKDLSNLSNGLTNTICITPATTTSTASSAKPAVVVENYVNGANWYRIWSDGWCEQGGYTTQHNDNVSITLISEMLDTNYCVQITKSQTAGAGNYGVAVINKSTTSINVAVSTERSVTGFYWEVKGQRA